MRSPKRNTRRGSVRLEFVVFFTIVCLTAFAAIHSLLHRDWYRLVGSLVFGVVGIIMELNDTLQDYDFAEPLEVCREKCRALREAIARIHGPDALQERQPQAELGTGSQS